MLRLNKNHQHFGHWKVGKTAGFSSLLLKALLQCHRHLYQRQENQVISRLAPTVSSANDVRITGNPGCPTTCTVPPIRSSNIDPSPEAVSQHLDYRASQQGLTVRILSSRSPVSVWKLLTSISSRRYERCRHHPKRFHQSQFFSSDIHPSNRTGQTAPSWKK